MSSDQAVPAREHANTLSANDAPDGLAEATSLQPTKTSISDEPEDDLAEQHRQRIKLHHAQLREKLVQESRDAQDQAAVAMAVWRDHLEEESALKAYAESMRTLAVSCWKRDDSHSRVAWTRKTVDQYFRKGGLEKALAKDARRRLHRRGRNPGEDASEAGPAHDNADASGAVIASKRKAEGCAATSRPEFSLHTYPSAPDSSHVKRAKKHGDSGAAVDEGRTSKLRLLDVGSCFNPFAEFVEEFDVLAVDISPATPSVRRCDFVNVAIEDGDGSILGDDLSGPAADYAQQGVVHELKASSFDVVVFSLLLSYMPSPLLRYRCCQNARRVLRTGGLLVIISPDSNNLNKGVQWMKSWRKAIEHIGFRRLRYEKLPHLHCIAYRAVDGPDTVTDDETMSEDDITQLMTIPQDGSSRSAAASRQ